MKCRGSAHLPRVPHDEDCGESARVSERAVTLFEMTGTGQIPGAAAGPLTPIDAGLEQGLVSGPGWNMASSLDPARRRLGWPTSSLNENCSPTPPAGLVGTLPAVRSLKCDFNDVNTSETGSALMNKGKMYKVKLTRIQNMHCTCPTFSNYPATDR